MVSSLTITVIIILLSATILYFLYFKKLRANSKVSLPVFLCAGVGIILIVSLNSIAFIEDKKDEASLEYQTIVVQINAAETDEEFELAYNNAVNWLNKTNGKLIDGATKEQRKELEEFIDYYKDYFK